MGRKGDNFWQHAVKLNGRFKCNYCKDIIPGGATRIKSHLSGIRGNGVKPCPLVPDNVRAAALVEVVDSSNRRAKTVVGSSNFEGCSNSASAQGMQNLDEITTNYDSLDENMKVLKQKLEKLTRREADIKSKVEELESLPGKKRKIEVETWLRDVKQGKRHVFGIETDIKKLTQEVTKLVERELPESLIQDDVDQTREDDLSWATNLLRFSRALENFAKNESKFLKKSFLYCAFYLENEELDIDSLITRLRDEGLIDGTKSLEGQFEEGLNILHQLENGGLLEVVSNNRVIMHELYRVTAKSYTKGRFVVKANMGLTRIPHEIKSSVHVENMEKVSLFNNKIDEISLSTSPKFLKLTTLILCRNPLGEITDYFFLHMPAIQVLDLSYTNIKILPDTVSDLRSLTTLCLSHCSSLRYVPCLAKLQDLMRLDLSSSIIPELPQGLEMLLNLRWLNLSGLFYLEKLTPMLVVSKLTKLQYLALPWNTYKVKVKPDDLKELKMLETFTGNFHDSHHFNAYVKTMQEVNRGLRNYIMALNLSEDYLDAWCDMKLSKESKLVIIENLDVEIPLLLPVDVRELYILKSLESRKSLCEVFSSASTTATSLRLFDILEVDDQKEYLFCFSCSFCTSLHHLEELYLHDVATSYIICEENEATWMAPALTPHGIFSFLKRLDISSCHKIKKLFTPVFLSCIQNVQTISIHNCMSISEIFSESSSIEEVGSRGIYTEEEIYGYNSYAGVNNTNDLVAPISTSITLPKLVTLELSDLPVLMSICRGIMVCGSLTDFSVSDCPQLQRLPQTIPPIEININHI